jgi:hypothetical protein
MWGSESIRVKPLKTLYRLPVILFYFQQWEIKQTFQERMLRKERAHVPVRPEPEQEKIKDRQPILRKNGVCRTQHNLYCAKRGEQQNSNTRRIAVQVRTFTGRMSFDKPVTQSMSFYRTTIHAPESAGGTMPMLHLRRSLYNRSPPFSLASYSSAHG